ncbi:hypothetical protein JJD41_17200 [Oxynema sp. CENA135]|uniref:hypothetical protein n=1 Tax=Oxynema sp. CENA135 TaxID=984206 RepID=UPI00190AFFD4|nr:hypothetical protein [Oxynema sp. CENA135]MBK4731588.1 hypothetical protein [Oxynema sp. CENA135]
MFGESISSNAQLKNFEGDLLLRQPLKTLKGLPDRAILIYTIAPGSLFPPCEYEDPWGGRRRFRDRIVTRDRAFARES